MMYAISVVDSKPQKDRRHDIPNIVQQYIRLCIHMVLSENGPWPHLLLNGKMMISHWIFTYFKVCPDMFGTDIMCNFDCIAHTFCVKYSHV